MDHGIQRHLTNPYNPSQNRSERKNRTLIESACSMLQTAGLSNTYWAEAIQTACYFQNCSYTSGISHATPFELSTGIKPNLCHIHIFSSPAYSKIHEKTQTKLETKAFKFIFVGYIEPLGIKGYRLYHVESQRLFFSREVIFAKHQSYIIKIKHLKDLLLTFLYPVNL